MAGGFVPVPDWFGWENQDCGVAVADVDGDGQRALVDHVFIVAGGEITKAARNRLGNALDASRRSQIMFMDLDDILNLYIVNNLPLPTAAMPPVDTWATPGDEPPF